jgi:hypothetical protein
MLTAEDLNVISQTVGKQAGEKIAAELREYDKKAIEFANTAAKGKISDEVFEAFKKDQNTATEKLQEILLKQGTTITELSTRLETSKADGAKSIAETLYDDKAELEKVFNQGSGNKSYMLMINAKGEPVMKPHNASAQKTVGPVATVSGINGGTAASIFQAIDAASLLRLGGDSMIFSQYRNQTWLFDLVTIVNAGWDNMMAMWFEEVVKTGTSATVAEGGVKPLVQYGYTLKTQTYKKEAMLIGFTEEFSLDFARLQSDILQKGRIDVMNRINTALLADLIAAATAYSTGTAYKNGAVVPTTNYNDYITIDAAAAQVDAATFGAKANAAIMNTYKNHRVNTQMDSQGRFLMPPAALNGIAMVGNPAMATDDLIVGDLKQLTLILRGGLIVRVGYNGTDFAQNMFSTVIEQYYYDYISAIRAVAIVKGQTFSAIKTAITT